MQTRFVHQHDEEMNILKKERRPGRPASTREDILRIKIAADEKEYRDGFCGFPMAHSTCSQLMAIRSARPYGCRQCGLFGSMGRCVVISVYLEMGENTKRWHDSCIQVSAKRTSIMDEIWTGIKGINRRLEIPKGFVM